jgi:hypothetical protein
MPRDDFAEVLFGDIPRLSTSKEAIQYRETGSAVSIRRHPGLRSGIQRRAKSRMLTGMMDRVALFRVPG